MRTSSRVIFLALLTVNASAFAQSKVSPTDLFQDAFKNLEKGDCKTAVVQLTQYQSMAGKTLEANPEFKAQVEAQRQLCLKRLTEPAKLTPGIAGKPILDQRNVVRDLNKTIQLRTN